MVCVDTMAQVPWLGCSHQTAYTYVCMLVCRCGWTYLYAVSPDSWGIWIDLNGVEWFYLCGDVWIICVKMSGGLDLVPEVVGIN